MSGYKRHAPIYLLDATDTPVGVIDRLGREWLFPASLNVAPDGGSIGNLAFGQLLHDDTDTPIGFQVFGREFIFAAPFTANTTRGLRQVKRPLLLSAAGVPLGLFGKAGVASQFAVAPVENGSSGGAAPDVDVTAFATAVTTAGGTLPAAHQNALNTYMPALKASGAWALIKELWIPLGNDSDLTTAAVKLKNGATSPSVTLTNFVSTDYTVALGVYTQTGNASKKVVTDFVPATNGSLATGEWGMSYYGTKMSGTGVVMGSAANSNSFIANSGTQSKIAGTVVSLQPTNSPAGEQGGNIRLSSVQYTGGNATAYTGGWAHNVVAGTAVSQTGGLSLFSTNNSFFCSAATGGYAVHAPMTPAHLRALQTFIDNVSEAIGRTIFQDNLTVTGDSYTAPTPTGPSSAANGWCYKVAAARGYAGGWLATPPSGVNAGVPGSGWGPPCSGGQMNNGNSGRDRIFRAVLQNPSKHWMIALGVNDDFQSGTNAAVNSSSAATFQFINDVGYPLKYAAVGTNYPTSASPDGTVGAAIHTTLLANAAAAGFTQIVDFYSGLTFNNTSVEVGVHKNDAGHALLTTDVTNAITAGNWAGW